MFREFLQKGVIFSLLFTLFCFSGYADGIEKPLIFPVPQNVEMRDGIFNIDNNTFLMVPEKGTGSDLFLAGLIINEFTDKYERPLEIRKRSVIRVNEKFILAGDISNPLVAAFCKQKDLTGMLNGLGPEGYILSVTESYAVVAANSSNGALYGVESLRQIINKKAGNLYIPQLIVRDSPRFEFRGIKLYLPGRENIVYFKRFIKDFAAYYKFNKIILELNANMRLESHPELNIGAVQFARHLNLNRLDRPAGINMEFQNSSHQDNGDGGILEKEEVADLVNFMRKYSIEVIPELPSLTHSYYLLAGHEELAENLAQPYPDTYCPLKTDIYKIYFDVLDEYIEVINPSVIHIGHDEWRMEKDLCELCRGKDYGQLYADDVIKIHDYLSEKGIRTALWGDHLLESVTKRDHQEWESSTGYKYKIPGALKPDQVIKLIPKDILVFNWFWSDSRNDKQLDEFGFSQVYGNFTPEISDWDQRVKTRGLMGGAPSSWAATTEKNFGKDLIYDFLGTANLLWSDHYIHPDSLGIVTQLMIGEIRSKFRGQQPPSDLGGLINSLNISAYFNSSQCREISGLNFSSVVTGELRNGNIVFNLNMTADSAGKAIIVPEKCRGKSIYSVEGIEVNNDINSMIFLHACAKPALNDKAYRMIYNFDETSELLGWYEIIYEDGFIESVPVRYGVNILDWGWKQRMGEVKGDNENAQRYVYEADAMECSKDKNNPVTFFSYEWKNTRPGKIVRAINLKSKSNTEGDNKIIILAISITEAPVAEKAIGTEKE